MRIFWVFAPDFPMFFDFPLAKNYALHNKIATGNN